MKVSCIIPVYNTSKYLKKCIESVLNQTYQEFEIILVNDCSTDKSAEICNNYQQKFPNKIVFIDKPENQGVDKARFTGLEYVYNSNPDGAVLFLDSDDYLGKESFERLINEMENTNADIVQMRGNRFKGIIRLKYYSPIDPKVIEQPELFKEYYISFFGINILDVNMCLKLYRVKLISDAQISPTGFRMGEDLMFNLKLFPLVKKYTIIDYRGYNYRVGGLTSRYNPTLWDDLKKQYLIKRQYAHNYSYIKAYRPLNIELKNIFLSAIYQRIQYWGEDDYNLKEWIAAELNDSNIWNDISELSKSDETNEFRIIAAKDADSLIKIARQRLYDSRWRRRIKKLA